MQQNLVLGLKHSAAECSPEHFWGKNVLGRSRIVVYSTALERRHARKGIESSNLSSSAMTEKTRERFFLFSLRGGISKNGAGKQDVRNEYLSTRRGPKYLDFCEHKMMFLYHESNVTICYNCYIRFERLGCKIHSNFVPHPPQMKI